MTRPRVILHADMDAFYASIEQRDDPALRGKPVIVGGTGLRGVVAAASYEAREFGVHSAMPTAEARRRCPHGIFLRGSMSRYVAESKRIFEIFRRFTPVVQGLSLDEAFLDLTGTDRLQGPAADVGVRLRQTVQTELDLAVSVGIAPVKMVAKVASDLAKPNGLFEVRPADLTTFLEPLSIRRLWGVGPVAEKHLRRLGYTTVGDLMGEDPVRLQRRLGEWGVRMARLARSQDFAEVEPYREPVSMSEENTFGGDVCDRGVLDSTIVTHSESVARRLRRDRWLARTVVLKLKLSRRTHDGPRGYPLLTRRVTLECSTDDGTVIAAAARAQLARAALDEPIRLLGVGVTNLEAQAREQLDLFGRGEGRAKRRRLNRALDELADRFGADAVVRGNPVHATRAGLSFQIKRGEGQRADDPEELD